MNLGGDENIQSIADGKGWGFPGDTEVNNLPAKAGGAGGAGDEAGLTPGSRRSPEEENGNSLQYSCLEKFHGQRSLAGCSPWGRKELDTTEQMSMYVLNL